LIGFIDDATIDAAVDCDRPLELSPKPGVVYRAHVDPSGGAVGGDSYTIAIGHIESEYFVVDVARGRQGPFDPKAVTLEYVALCKAYRIRKVTGDRYGAEWVTAACARLVAGDWRQPYRRQAFRSVHSEWRAPRR
jgi:hypothetical protein